MSATKQRRNKAALGVIFSNAFSAGLEAAKVLDASDLVEAPAAPEVDMDVATSALEAYFNANAAKKLADRDMRRARKLIDTLKAGVYGAWKVVWKPSTRETPDLEAIARIFRENGLGKVPMKKCSDSLEVTEA